MLTALCVTLLAASTVLARPLGPKGADVGEPDAVYWKERSEDAVYWKPRSEYTVVEAAYSKVRSEIRNSDTEDAVVRAYYKRELKESDLEPAIGLVADGPGPYYRSIDLKESDLEPAIGFVADGPGPYYRSVDTEESDIEPAISTALTYYKRDAETEGSGLESDTEASATRPLYYRVRSTLGDADLVSVVVRAYEKRSESDIEPAIGPNPEGVSAYYRVRRTAGESDIEPAIGPNPEGISTYYRARRSTGEADIEPAIGPNPKGISTYYRARRTAGESDIEPAIGPNPEGISTYYRARRNADEADIEPAIGPNPEGISAYYRVRSPVDGEVERAVVTAFYKKRSTVAA